MQVKGTAWRDQVAVGLNCYSDSSVCKDHGVTWLLLRTLDSPREMKSFKDKLKNTHREPKASMTALRESFLFCDCRVDMAEG